MTHMVIIFMDGAERHYCLGPNYGWRVDRERNNLILGHGLDRMEFPLCNIRYWMFKP